MKKTDETISFEEEKAKRDAEWKIFQSIVTALKDLDRRDQIRILRTVQVFLGIEI